MSNTELTTEFRHVGSLFSANAGSTPVTRAAGFLSDAFRRLSLTLMAAFLLIGTSASLTVPSIDHVEFWLNAVAAGY